ncbi:thioesterase family protein [Caulobacter sp. KR2-114]|uniref:thioesterase family protein n=1 Tax=Caulobacter sp. KR2-114 TaxID=3400912 RepID=UPI003C08D01E
MTEFTELLAGVARSEAGWTSHVSDDWLQGRTLYGGLSAALCLNAALAAFEGLPPLRSAQLTFIGPATGAVTASPSLLRQGKSAAYVGVDLTGDAGLATRAVFTFGAARQSAFCERRMPAPAAPPPEACEPFFVSSRPTFAQHFEVLSAGRSRPVTAAEPDYLVWLRHRDPAARSGVLGLMALADATPPAAMAMFAAGAPISTMTWMVDLLADADELGGDGWLLLESRAETVCEGYSAQPMAIWTSDGRPLVSARQCVAVFA